MFYLFMIKRPKAFLVFSQFHAFYHLFRPKFSFYHSRYLYLLICRVASLNPHPFFLPFTYCFLPPLTPFQHVSPHFPLSSYKITIRMKILQKSSAELQVSLHLLSVKKPTWHRFDEWGIIMKHSQPPCQFVSDIFLGWGPSRGCPSSCC